MIELTIPQLELLQDKLKDIPEKIPVVTARAINRATQSAKTQAGRSVRETYIVKHKDVLSTMKVKKAFPADLNAEIRSIGNPLELTKFKVKKNKPLPTRGRYAVTSVKKGSSKSISGGFVLGMNNGHVNVFTRVTKKRLPIRGHYGPSIPQMLGNDSVSQAVENKAQQELDSRLEHEINRVIRS